jgi:hypothetical protein
MISCPPGTVAAVKPPGQGSSAPLAKLSAPGAISAETSVHAVEEPGLPLENLRADAPGAAELQCALKGGRPLRLDGPGHHTTLKAGRAGFRAASLTHRLCVCLFRPALFMTLLGSYCHLMKAPAVGSCVAIDTRLSSHGITLMAPPRGC